MRCRGLQLTACTGAIIFAALLLPALFPGYAMAESDIDTLRMQLEEQRALIREQSELLKQQQHKLDSQSRELEDLSRRLEQMEQAGAAQPSLAAQPPAPAAETAKAEQAQAPTERDSIGDMNADAVRAGQFPGSFRIPGPRNISLAIGGFVKTAVIYDSKAEAMGSDFIPATLGTSRPEKKGATSLDVTLTRLFIDGRAPYSSGHVRGYVEYDLNAGNNGSPDFKLRHAYGSWKNDYGTLTAGHTWSTAMDLKILPDGLTEPTVSGVIFVRQAQVRWSQPLASGLTMHVAMEDPSSSDVTSDAPVSSHTTVPDAIAGLEYDPDGSWHVRLNGLVRRLKIELPGGSYDAETAWALAMTSHINLFSNDRLVLSAVYGEGTGRYLLGIQSSAGSIVDPVRDELELRENWGVMASYKHQWTSYLRSTVMGGYARSKPFRWQSGDMFESSTYAAANLMWSLTSYMTLGVEYAYGQRLNVDDTRTENHRVAVGMQFY